MTVRATVSDAPIDVGGRHGRLLGELSAAGCAGAISSFVGTVRAVGQQGQRIEGMELEYYPGMTERQLSAFAEEIAGARDLQAVDVVHRHGRLAVGEVIVHVLVAAERRGEAIGACSWLVERLKHEVPFWKKEHGSDGGRWVTPEAG